MDTISSVFEQLIHQVTGEKRRYSKKEWVKRRQPRRARFLAKVLWYDKGTVGPFYGYDFEQRLTGQGKRKQWPNDKGVMTVFMENEHVGLIKLLHWLEEEKKSWYCATIYMCTDETKLTGKDKDERAEYSHTVFKEVHSRNSSKRIKWLNESLKFDDDGMVERGRIKALRAPVATQKQTA